MDLIITFFFVAFQQNNERHGVSARSAGVRAFVCTTVRRLILNVHPSSLVFAMHDEERLRISFLRIAGKLSIWKAAYFTVRVTGSV